MQATSQHLSDWDRQYEERLKQYINKKVKVKCKVYGSIEARECIIYTNLTTIPAGSVGKIIQIDNCIELKTEYYTVEFDGGVYAHLNASVFDESFLESPRKKRCQKKKR